MTQKGNPYRITKAIGEQGTPTGGERAWSKIDQIGTVLMAGQSLVPLNGMSGETYPDINFTKRDTVLVVCLVYLQIRD